MSDRWQGFTSQFWIRSLTYDDGNAMLVFVCDTVVAENFKRCEANRKVHGYVHEAVLFCIRRSNKHAPTV